MSYIENKFGLVMFGVHKIGHFQIDDLNILSSYHTLKNVEIQSNFVDVVTSTVSNIHLLYVKDAGNGKYTLINDMGKGNLFAHGLWLTAASIIMPRASFITENINKSSN